jgi:RsiW-degrading membrane proteinase PrsW (M82 family)
MVPFTLIAIFAAAVPTILYTLIIWWLDRYEKEPLHLLVATFVWGSLPAILLAICFELILETPTAQSPLGPAAVTWALAPLVEEPVKALALIALFLFARREFDGILDGIVYGALIGFGFAMTENLLFFLNHPADLNGQFWLRSVVFGFNHALFTSIVGLALGSVRYAPQRWLGYVALSTSMVLAILLHGLHNIAVNYQLLGMAFAWVVQWSGVLTLLAITGLAWNHEHSWIEQELGEEITRGTISMSDYAEVLSASRRTRTHMRVLAQHGLSRYLRVRRLHHLMIELAFCKYQLRVGDRFQHQDERERLRRAIIALRADLNSAGELPGQTECMTWPEGTRKSE